MTIVTTTLHCPLCGDRPASEFTYAEDVPTYHEMVGLDEDGDYVASFEGDALIELGGRERVFHECDTELSASGNAFATFVDITHGDTAKEIAAATAADSARVKTPS